MSVSIDFVISYIEELKVLASSLCEDVKDSNSMTEAWNKVDRFYRDIESMRNRQKCTGSKSFSVITDDVPGHTKYLQGLDLPIMLNTICDDVCCRPSDVAEMHIEEVNDKLVLLITPKQISLPALDFEEINYDGKIINCPDCGEKIVIQYNTARCKACGWMAAGSELEDIMEE